MYGKTFFTWIIFVIGVLLSIDVAGQDGWNSARLSLLYGGSIPFNFNSMKAYSEGVEILDGTIFGITLSDNDNTDIYELEGFELIFRTFNGQNAIEGDVDNLPLNVIRVKAENNLGLGTGTSYGYQDLEATSVHLFSYRNIPFSDLRWDTHQLSLSYMCGKPVLEGGNGTLLGSASDYYTVEIEVMLFPAGPGF